MCGRYRLSVTHKELAERFGAVDEVEWAPRYNIAPTDMVPIVRQDPKQPLRRLTLAKWGLVPSWSKDASGGPKMINARAEGIKDRASFRDAFRARRCLVPANGFYEWRKLEKGKQPFHIGMPDGSLFGFAGLWERWRSPGGDWLRSCSIITVDSSGPIREIHDRMPLVIPEERYDEWLDPALTDPMALEEMLQPTANARLITRPVSRRVNDVKNDDAACIEDPPPTEPEQGTLAL
jgi:putative SOS response-associated peptidase YedK